MWMKIKSGSAVYKAGGFYFKIGGDWGWEVDKYERLLIRATLGTKVLPPGANAWLVARSQPKGGPSGPSYYSMMGEPGKFVLDEYKSAMNAEVFVSGDSRPQFGMHSFNLVQPVAYGYPPFGDLQIEVRVFVNSTNSSAPLLADAPLSWAYWGWK